MAKFYDLSSLEIKHELITIRRYRESDFASLEAIFEQEFFTWFFSAYQNCLEFVQEKMADYERGNLVMLVIIDNQTQHIIGTSSLYDISFRHKRIEMGSSWLARAYQGTQYNALAKFLLINYLLNTLEFNRIQWKTDALNVKSKTAMLKLGFVYEGTLRRHAITYSGRVRDSLVFAVTDIDWQHVSVIMQERIKKKSLIMVQK
ncbi:MAG: N-acetyltransferase [Neisseriales bacterium]|nr:MAG: N-acetyltransferase [Neisseriales bacterium]